MKYFYDGQVRRYIGQIIRMLSGFKYQTSDGKQITVPVTYGDLSRQVAHIIRDNSENKIPSAPRIATYISGLALDRSRLADATHISKVHIRERRKLTDEEGNFLGYDVTQGDLYTVERLMPTPYKLTIKADIWATNTDQKLQIMEQILMLFNPSLEIQTTDNYVDWSSLSVVELTDVIFSSRSIPAGLESEIDIGTLTFETPIWISPPSKVKRMGVIHDIIMNIHDESYSFETEEAVNIGNFDVFVYYDPNSSQYYIELLEPKSFIMSLPDDQQEAWKKSGQDLNWRYILDRYPGRFKAGSSQIFLIQSDGNEVVGTVAINELDETKLVVAFDQDTYNTNTVINGVINRGTIDAIINPETYNPGTPTGNPRYLILKPIGGGIRETFVNSDRSAVINTGIDFDSVYDIELYIDDLQVAASGSNYNGKLQILSSSVIPVDSTVTYILNVNDDGPDAWKSADGSDFIADSNDIIEWDGSKWVVVFDASDHDKNQGEPIYTTNMRTGVQYVYEGSVWSRAFEGEYPRGKWRLML
jgi:hypothetical protein